uniref:Uncharacterized protein n=1 Tax=Panagrolaimus davidi TaxID=227884 RepID=A0A914QIX5_9BILA
MNIIDEIAIVPDKVQMVFNKNYFSVSFYANGKEHKLNDADGSNKTPIYIAFTEEEPIIGKCATEIFNEKPNFVVFGMF